MTGAAVPSGPDRAALAAADLGRAAAEIRRLAGSPLALLTGGGRPVPCRHYPLGDVYDRDSHAQYYFHTHRQAEAGHIHLFLRARGMPPGLVPQVATADADPPCHLVAVGLGEDGWPETLFTTNRWVTGEAWYSAAAVAAMLPRFRPRGGGRLAALSLLLSSLVALAEPEVADLAMRRDAAVAAWAAGHGGDPLEDERLEVTSQAPLDLGRLVASVLGA